MELMSCPVFRQLCDFKDFNAIRERRKLAKLDRFDFSIFKQISSRKKYCKIFRELFFVIPIFPSKTLNKVCKFFFFHFPKLCTLKYVKYRERVICRNKQSRAKMPIWFAGD